MISAISPREIAHNFIKHLNNTSPLTHFIVSSHHNEAQHTTAMYSHRLHHRERLGKDKLSSTRPILHKKENDDIFDNKKGNKKVSKLGTPTTLEQEEDTTTSSPETSTTTQETPVSTNSDVIDDDEETIEVDVAVDYDSVSIKTNEESAMPSLSTD